jgi:hypothetical protein
MPELTAQFEVFCSKCGAGLCMNTTVRDPTSYNGVPGVYVEPCEKCRDDAHDEGFDEGYAKREAEEED